MPEKQLRIRYVGDASGVKKALGEIDRGHSALEAKLKRTGANLSRTGATLTRRLTLPIVAGMGVAVAEFTEFRQVNAQTAAALKSTGGAARVTIGHVQGLSERVGKLAAVEGDVVQQSANVLLTFTKIQNQGRGVNAIFDRAQLSVANLSARLGTDMQSAAIQVGKALNDPIRGLTSLSRAGIQFTDQQRRMIERMVESGRVLDAQKIVLKELETQFGGSAKAAGRTASPFTKLALAGKDLAESFGRILMPVVDKATSFLRGLMERFRGLSPATQRTITMVAGFAAALGPALWIVGKLISGLGGLVGAFGGLRGSIVKLVGTGGAGAPIKLLLAGIAAYIGYRQAFQHTTNVITEAFLEGGAAARQWSRRLREANDILGQMADARVPVVPFASLGDIAAGVLGPLNSLNDAQELAIAAHQKATKTVRDQVRELRRMPGAMNPAKDSMIEAMIAAGDYSGAMRWVVEFERQWIREAKRKQGGILDVTGAQDGLTQSVKNYHEWLNREERQDRRRQQRLREHRENMNRLEGATRQYITTLLRIPPRERTNVVLDTSNAVDKVKAFTTFLSGNQLRLLKAHSGTTVPGAGFADKVPALLTPGEEVIRKEQAERWRPVLKAINDGRLQAPEFLREYNAGGEVAQATRGLARAGRDIESYVDALRNLAVYGKLAAPNVAMTIPPATGALAGATPAIREIWAATMAQFPDIISYGIKVIRNIAGTNTWSQHAYGNAWDASRAGWPGSLDPVWGWLKANAGRLPVNIPYSLFRMYGGGSPHLDHIHIAGRPLYGGNPYTGGYPINAWRGFQGLVKQPTVMTVAEKRPEWVSVTPVGSGGAGGPGGDIIVNVHVYGSAITEGDLARAVRDELLKLKRRTPSIGLS